jgi:hypothetical protein
MRVGRERPSRPRTEPSLLGGGSMKRSGSGCAYILLFSAFLAPPLRLRLFCGVVMVVVALAPALGLCESWLLASQVNAIILTASFIDTPQHARRMSERRRAEIEAKKAKLEELRKARAERQRQALVQDVRRPCLLHTRVNPLADFFRP